MDTPGPDNKSNESRLYSGKFITAELKAYLASRILLHYVTGKKWKKGSRLQFDVELFTDYLFEACNGAADAGLIPQQASLEIGLIMCFDEDFYSELCHRSREL